MTDTGQGISAEFLPRIFDRFSQQESGNSKSFAGLGIGLTIVRHLVEAHRGTIEATSEGQGEAPAFRVRLPLTQRASAPAHCRRCRVLLPGCMCWWSKTTLDARALIGRLLSDAGARVSEATGADEALAHVGQSAPHVMVSDIGMAKRDGYQLMRALRAGGYLGAPSGHRADGLFARRRPR